MPFSRRDIFTYILPINNPSIHPCANALTVPTPAIHAGIHFLGPERTKAVCFVLVHTQIKSADQTPLISILSASFPSIRRKNLDWLSHANDAISAPAASLGPHDRSL